MNANSAKFDEMHGLLDVLLPDTRTLQYHKYPDALASSVSILNEAFNAGVTPQQISDDCAQAVLCLGIPLDPYQYASARSQAFAGEFNVQDLMRDHWVNGGPMPSCEQFKERIFGGSPAPPALKMFVLASSPGGIPLPPGAGMIPLANITVGAGIWHVSAFAGIKHDTGATGFFVIGVQKNGIIQDGATVGFALRADTGTQANSCVDMQCAAGDVLSVFLTVVCPIALVSGNAQISAFKVQ